MKKTEKKDYSKKQRVRVLATGELGTVTDRVLMPGRDGRARPYVQVRLDGRPGLDRWFWPDQLGGTRERCRATFEAEDGRALTLEVTMDHDKDKGNLALKITGRPENMKEHRGLHAVLAAKLVKAIAGDGHR